MKYAYFKCRLTIFRNDVRQVVIQLNQLSLFIILFLGVALPALVFALMLGFGIILSNKDPAYQTLLIAWCMLAVQSIVLIVLLDAIKGSKYALFLKSLQASSADIAFSNLLLTLICHPLLLINIFIMLFIPFNRWLEIPHGIMLIILQISTAAVLLRSTTSTYWFLCCSFFYLLCIVLFKSTIFVDGISLLQHLLALIFLQISISLFSFIPQSTFNIPQLKIQRARHIPIYFHIWLSSLTQKKGVLPMQSTVFMLLCIMAHYSILKMPQYSLVINLIASHLILLIAASTQLVFNRVINEHALFFASFKHQASFLRMQYILPFGIGLLMLISFFAIQQTMSTVVVNIACLLVCIVVASIKPKRLIAVWFLSGAIAASLIFSF